MRAGRPPYRKLFQDARHLVLWAVCAAAFLGEGTADKQVPQEYGPSESSFLVHVELFNLDGERNSQGACDSEVSYRIAWSYGTH